MGHTHQQGWVSWLLSSVLFVSTSVVGYYYYDLSGNHDSLQTDNKKLAADLRSAKRAEKSNSAELETLTSQIASLNQQISKSAESEKAFDSQKNQLTKRNSSLNDDNDELSANNEELSTLNETLNATNLELSNLNDELSASSQELSGFNEELSASNLELSDLNDELSTGNQELSGLNEELSASNEELNALNEELSTNIANLNIDIKNLNASNNDLNGKNEGLSTQLEDTQKLLAKQTIELQDQNSELSLQLKEKEGLLTDSKGALETLQSELDEAATTAQLYQAAREELALKQAENETYSETIERLKTEMAEETKAMTKLEEELQSQLTQFNQEKEKLVTQLKDGTTAIKLPESILFPSGSADLNEEGIQALTVLADALSSFPNHLISIQGHTDSRKISQVTQQIYPSNWELSSARAASAVRALIAHDVPEHRMQAVGFAATRPLVDETDRASLQQNRRIEVILLPNK